MAELCCKAEKCTYNKENLCCKGDIMVGGKHAENEDDTCCESFSDRKGDSYSSSIEHPSKTISIDCEAAGCKYNANYKCYAEHVTIKGSGASECRATACGTFEEKS